MSVWLCSFEPGAMRKVMCPAFVLQWPAFCIRLASAGFQEMMEHVDMKHAQTKSQHFMHGLLEVEAGIPYNGPLTSWDDATFAQHTLFGMPGSYSIHVKSCYFFTIPIPVFTHIAAHGEAVLQLRPNNMAFQPSCVEKMLQASLAVVPPISLANKDRADSVVVPQPAGSSVPSESLVVVPQCPLTVRDLFQQQHIHPSTVKAIQVLAPFIPFLKQKRLTELAWFCQWPAVVPGFPPFWLNTQAKEGNETKESSTPVQQKQWQVWQNTLNVFNKMACHITKEKCSEQLLNEMHQTALHLQEADIMLFHPILVDNNNCNICCQTCA